MRLFRRSKPDELPNCVAPKRRECCDSLKGYNHRITCSTLKDYPLAPFQPLRQCPKCGSEGAYTEYHAALWYGWIYPAPETGQCLLTPEYLPVEHLDRTCATCKYAWLEEVAPAVALS